MEESVLLGTKPLVDSIRHFIRDPSGVFSVCHLCECRIVQWRHDSRLLLLLNWFLHIIKRTLHVGSKIWILCSRGKNNISRVSGVQDGCDGSLGIYFNLCTRHRWHKRKEQKTMKTYQADFPWTENKDLYCFTSSVSRTRSFDNIWTTCQCIWSGKVYIWLSVWEFKKLCLRQPCLNKLMHVENWNPDHLCGHFIQIHSCMSNCFSCMYTNNYKHFHKKFGIFYSDNSLLIRVPDIQ